MKFSAVWIVPFLFSATLSASPINERADSTITIPPVPADGCKDPQAFLRCVGGSSGECFQPLPQAQAVCIQYFTSETVVLALAFHPEIPDLIGVSLSSGEIALCQTQTQAKKPSVVLKLPAHSLEAWTVIITETNFDESGGDILYSGGDDSALCAHAVRSPNVIREVQQIESRRYERAHGAGVTAIVPLPLYPILLTGSYDDHVRVFNPQDSKVLAEAKIGGGVWRLKMLSPYKTIRMEEEGTSFRVLASCMHAGARILRVSRSRRGAWAIEVVAKFEEHGSMNYGSDAQPPRREFLRDHAHVTCVSTSFYDKLLCVWRYDEHEDEDP
ncbi:MAG: hypothetical protein M1836_000183 [Candelina mexicana]|nr:MAG: hypothetical protein M1836_000183 [Candelina mexicana]